MPPTDIWRIAEIDRSEEIRQAYEFKDGILQVTDVHWTISNWLRDGEGEPSVVRMVSAWKPWLDDHGTTEPHIQRNRKLPGQHNPTQPVHNCHQIQPTLLHPDVGDVAAPDLIPIWRINR